MHSLRVLLAASILVVSAAPALADPGRREVPRQLRFEPMSPGTSSADGYRARGTGYDVVVDRNAVTFGFKNVLVSMRLTGATAATRLTAADRLPGVTNYLIGDRTQWVRGVAAYGRIVREGTYPGIDMVLRGDDGAFAYDFLVRPGAKPNAIKIHFDGVSGIRLDDRGDLILTTAAGEITHRRPVAYQDHEGVRRLVPARFHLGRNRTVSLVVGEYDRRHTLVIDPTVVRATYFGGSNPIPEGGYEDLRALTVDSAGNLYLTGGSSSTVFPIAGAPAPVGEGGLIVSKLDASGNVVYITLLPASMGSAIAVDDAGAVYIAGETSNEAFVATPGTVGGSGRAFVIKLDSTGSNVVYIVKLPVRILLQLALDSAGNVVVGGLAEAGAPVFNALQPAHAGNYDGYVAKLTPDASAFVFATYFGGSGNDIVYDVALDQAGNIYLTGSTSSSDFPVEAALNGFGGEDDAFVAKLTADGSDILFSTYLGGGGFDAGASIAVDQSGNPIVSGYTASDDFPTRRAYQPLRNPSEWPDAFVTKFTADASTLVYSTFFGGESGDYAERVKVGPDGDAYLTGITASVDFPTVRPTQPLHGDGVSNPAGGGDAFVARFDPLGRPVYATFFGGSTQDIGRGVAVDASGTAHVVGQTLSDDLPLVAALQSELAQGVDGFLVSIADTPCPPDFTSQVLITPLPPIPLAAGYLRLQIVFVTNAGATPIATPASFTIDGLTPGIVLLSNGFTFCPATAGSQYAAVNAPGNTLAPGQTTYVPMLFLAFDPALTLTYTSRVLGGVPYR